MQESRSPAYINSYVKWPFRFDTRNGGYGSSLCGRNAVFPVNLLLKASAAAWRWMTVHARVR